MGGSQQRRPGTGGTAAAAQCKCLPCEQRRQEASSSALRCALLRPGDGSDVIGSGPTHTHIYNTHKHTNTNNTNAKANTNTNIYISTRPRNPWHVGPLKVGLYQSTPSKPTRQNNKKQ